MVREPRDAPAPSTAKVERIISTLRKHYGSPGRIAGGDPLDQLVATILSQNTNDANSGRAFSALQERFPDWQHVRDAPAADIAAAIWPGGLALQKAPRIKAILQRLSIERGELDLSFLHDMPTAEARGWLERLPGVGPKTASCVLLFALGRDVFPVDTHVERIAKRLGIVPASATPEAVQTILESATPAGQCMDGHLLLIRHGRTICRARAPLCEACPLRGFCHFFASLIRKPRRGLGAESEVCHTGPGDS